MGIKLLRVIFVLYITLIETINISKTVKASFEMNPVLISKKPHILNKRFATMIDLQYSPSEILAPYINYQQQDFKQSENSGDKFINAYNNANARSGDTAGQSAAEIGFYGNRGQLGVEGYVKDDRYLDAHGRVHKNEDESRFYNDAEKNRKGFERNKVYNGGNEAGIRGYSGSRLGSLGGHRKGHSSTGFHNTYHKDEFGNSSQYYDEAIDNGGHFYYDLKDGRFLNHAADKERGRFHDEGFKNQAKQNQGHFDGAQNYQAEEGVKKNFGNNQYFNHANDYGHDKQNTGYQSQKQAVDLASKTGQRNINFQDGDIGSVSGIHVGQSATNPRIKHNFPRPYKQLQVSSLHSASSNPSIVIEPFRNKVSGEQEYQELPSLPFTTYYGSYRGVQY